MAQMNVFISDSQYEAAAIKVDKCTSLLNCSQTLYLNKKK